MQLCVSRIVPLAPTPALPKAVAKLRPPRPDDPTPRLPPVGFSLARIGLANGSKRPFPTNATKEPRPSKKLKKDQAVDGPIVPLDASVKELGKKSRVGLKLPPANDVGKFKVPNLPPQKRNPEKGKGKEKASDVDLRGESSESDIESRNKLVRADQFAQIVRPTNAYL